MELSSLNKQNMPCDKLMGIACMEEELAFTVFLKTSLEERLGVKLYLFHLTHGSQRNYYYRVFLVFDNPCFTK